MKHAAVLLPYFRPWQDRPIQLSAKDQELYSANVVFVGHYEPDAREHRLRALVSEGLKVRIWGGENWNSRNLGELDDRMCPIVPASGEEYTKALSGADICLCFLSKLNRDTYTRRCFEIPACGKVMLAERTKDLLDFFEEDEEACFFSSDEELVRKARWLVENPDIRKRISEAGLRRVWKDGHDVSSRVEKFLDEIGTGFLSAMIRR